MRRPVSLLMVFGLATAAVLFLAACAGESDDSAEDTAPAAAAAQTEADDSTKASTDKSTSETAMAKEEAAPKVEEVPKLSLPITEDTLTAPRIMGEGVNEWINSEELILADLQAENKVVLIDFWTYTCINCIRTLPYLKQWHDKYADRGLVIVGIHTPEFEFEKSLDNVKEAVERFEIKYPVVQDNNYWTWNAFTNRYWPAKYLVDKDGYIRYSHFGEGRYDETEQAIRLLLEEADQAVADISDDENPIRLVAPNTISSRNPDGLTRELYAGTGRNYSARRSGIRAPYVLNEDFYKQANSDTEYSDPGDYQNHHIYLQGLWHNGEESLRHARMTEEFEDYMALRFNAVDVNVVLRTQSETPYKVQIRMDGAPLTSGDAGTDIWFDDEGRSFITVDEPRLYTLVRLDAFESHELTLSSNSDEFEIFAFTFGAYVLHPEA